jgi:hypothetical protein
MTIKIKLEIRKIVTPDRTTWCIMYQDRLLHSWAGEPHVYPTRNEAQWWTKTIARDIVEYNATLQENTMGQMAERIPLPD